MTTYKEAASIGFNVLAGQYNLRIFQGNFWFGGNTLHTCLNYLLAAKETDSKGILKYAYNEVYLSLDGPGWWRDDYSWWGNAFTLAIKHRNELGYQGAENDQLFNGLRTAAQNCWEKLKSNWSEETYGPATDNSAGSAKIIGGTFNTHNQPPMSGRNSVTNEGFWLLSYHLSKLYPENPDYSTYGSKESNWFGQWQKEYPKTHGGKSGILNAQGLVLERPTGNGTDPDWHWTGDQGLHMDLPFATLSLPYEIAVAVTTHMVDKDNILHEDMGFYKYGELQGFIADYATGKGIFMRSLARLNLAHRDHPFSDFIKKNATAVWCNRLQGNQFTFNWNPPQLPGQEPVILSVDGKSDALCNLIMQTSGLEALNAALWLSPNEEIACPPRG